MGGNYIHYNTATPDKVYLLVLIIQELGTDNEA